VRSASYTGRSLGLRLGRKWKWIYIRQPIYLHLPCHADSFFLLGPGLQHRRQEVCIPPELLQFCYWLTAWLVKAARQHDENEKKRFDVQLEAHWRGATGASTEKCVVDERRRKARRKCVPRKELTTRRRWTNAGGKQARGRGMPREAKLAKRPKRAAA
jgi:hypothetical protein